MNWLQNQAFQLVLPYFLTPLVFLIVQGLKKIEAVDAKLPSWAKPGLVYVVSQVAIFAQTWTGQALPCADHCTIADLANAESFIKAVLLTGSSMLLHYLKNRPAPKK